VDFGLEFSDRLLGLTRLLDMLYAYSRGILDFAFR